MIIPVNLLDKSYEIVLQRGALKNIGEYLSFEKKKSSIDLDGKVRIRNGYVLYDYTKGTTSST